MLATASEERPDAAPSAVSVLLVEDNADDAELALHGLSRCGLDSEVKWVRDGVEAMEWLDAGGAGTLRLLLLDLRMPRMDGFEVLRRLKGDPATRGIAVIVMVSAPDAPELERCFELGADAYLVKPLEAEPLRAALRDLNLRWGAGFNAGG